MFALPHTQVLAHSSADSFSPVTHAHSSASSTTPQHIATLEQISLNQCPFRALHMLLDSSGLDPASTSPAKQDPHCNWLTSQTERDQARDIFFHFSLSLPSVYSGATNFQLSW